MKHEKFTIDGWITAEGIHNPEQSWNGYAVPFFNLEQAGYITEKSNADIDYDETWERYNIKDGKIFLEFHGFDEKNEIEEVPSVDFEGVTYFGIGAGSWVWAVDEEEGE